jgi:drug/metabolite transporter (DMT)-like permease
MKKSFIQLHIAVFLAGFTGILGKLITLNEGLLVWYRLLISSITLWVIFFFAGRSAKIPGKDILKISGVGVIAALHWVSFYGCIKVANVSIALVCFSAIGFFTALIEPLVFRVRPDKGELLLGVLVMLGIYFIFHFDPHYQTGIAVGLIAALLGSIFPILSRKLLQRINFQTVTLYELTGGLISLTILLPFYLRVFPTSYLFPGLWDWIWLLVLSWLCTVVAMNLSMSALRKISAFTVNLTYNLEPIYGIALAFAVFREDKYFGSGFYAGFAIILLAIGLQMLRIVRKSRRTI